MPIFPLYIIENIFEMPFCATSYFSFYIFHTLVFYKSLTFKCISNLTNDVICFSLIANNFATLAISLLLFILTAFMVYGTIQVNIDVMISNPPISTEILFCWIISFLFSVVQAICCHFSVFKYLTFVSAFCCYLVQWLTMIKLLSGEAEWVDFFTFPNS